MCDVQVQFSNVMEPKIIHDVLLYLHSAFSFVFKEINTHVVHTFALGETTVIVGLVLSIHCIVFDKL
ncbi:MAG: hypothetical protein WCG25_09765 [bacterium]